MSSDKQDLVAVKKVPIVVLAGFLGSGKTTVLNHLLTEAKGTKIGVLINDFGKVAVDGKLVSGQIGEPVELASGCICCMMLKAREGTLAKRPPKSGSIITAGTLRLISSASKYSALVFLALACFQST